MGLTALREKKKHTQTKPNKTLRLVTIHWGLKTQNNRSVQETEEYLYIFYLWSTAWSNCPEHVHTTAGAWRFFSASALLLLRWSFTAVGIQRPCPKWHPKPSRSSSESANSPNLFQNYLCTFTFTFWIPTAGKTWLNMTETVCNVTALYFISESNFLLILLKIWLLYSCESSGFWYFFMVQGTLNIHSVCECSWNKSLERCDALFLLI